HVTIPAPAAIFTPPLHDALPICLFRCNGSHHHQNHRQGHHAQYVNRWPITRCRRLQQRHRRVFPGSGRSCGRGRRRYHQRQTVTACNPRGIALARHRLCGKGQSLFLCLTVVCVRNTHHSLVVPRTVTATVRGQRRTYLPNRVSTTRCFQLPAPYLLTTHYH